MIFFYEFYNMNGLDHQNESKMKPKMTELHLAVQIWTAEMHVQLSHSPFLNFKLKRVYG